MIQKSRKNSSDQQVTTYSSQDSMNTDDENTLVIDELIDDFGEEELQDEDLLEEERDIIDSDQNQKSPLEVIGDEDEEDVAIEDDLIVDQDTNLGKHIFCKYSYSFSFLKCTFVHLRV